MTRRLVGVERLRENWTQASYDIAIAAAGYESRSRHTFEHNPVQARHKVAAAFTQQQVLDYDLNIQWFSSHGFDVYAVNDSAYLSWTAQILALAEPAGPRLRILIDISSLSRVRIADLITTMSTFEAPWDLEVDFTYCLASFTAPALDQSPNSHVGPVTDAFSGWWSEPDRLLSVVVGLGYEQDKALGAVEYLQAQDVWTFTPVSVLDAYTGALATANETLLRLIRREHQFTYRVEDPLACFSTLQSLAQGLAVTNNVLLLPFGPKVFVLASLLVAAGDQQIAVWRVSAQATETPVDRKGTNNFYGLSVLFSR